MKKQVISRKKFNQLLEIYVAKTFPKKNSQYRFILFLELNKLKQQNSIQIPFILQYWHRALSKTKLLDLGCGTGGATVAWSLKGVKSFGIDQLEEDLRLAKLRGYSEGVSPRFILNKKLVLPIKSDTFDIVVCDQVLEHTIDLSKTVSEIKRVLKEDGIAYIDVPNRFFPLENHYHLLFVHWFPAPVCKFIIKIANRKYFDYPVFFLSYFKLRKELIKNQLEIVATGADYIRNLNTSSIKNIVAKVLLTIGIPFYFFTPTIQFIVRKRKNNEK